MDFNICYNNYSTASNNNQKFYRQKNCSTPMADTFIIYLSNDKTSISTWLAATSLKRFLSSTWRPLPRSFCEWLHTRTCASRNSFGQYESPADQHRMKTRVIPRKQRSHEELQSVLSCLHGSKRRVIYRCSTCGGNAARGWPHLLACSLID